MSVLYPVIGADAGPDALGILIPPGARTVLILRPRSLRWDLLLMRGNATTTFREMEQREANQVAESVQRALVRWSQGGPGHVEAVSAFENQGQLVWVDVDEHSFVLCARNPGQPYRPLVFGSSAEASQAAAQLRAVLCPPPDRRQEIYLNRRNFAR